MLRTISTTIGIILVAAPVLAPADDESAVVIEQVQWGFDGKAQERSFVPLSVLVRNRSPLEFEGTLTLTKLIQTTKPIDASIERDVYVGPLTSRWVQFFPLVVGDWEQWRLTWGHAADETFDVPTPSLGERATVLLYDPDDLQFSGGVLRRLPTNLFPASVTGTDGLRGVVLDRPPRWQGARRQAFLDWLTLGGRVYLLQDEQGRFPTFPESLAVLNEKRVRFVVGAGVVERIPRTVRALDAAFVKSRILSDPVTDPRDRRLQQYRRSVDFRGTAPPLNKTGWDRDTQMFLDLQSIVRFERRWWAVYLLVVAYLLCLFPLCYRVGREAKDYRWTYAVLFCAVGVFSYGFASLSKLGASEVARARSVAVARQVRPGLFDVTQWACVAVRGGGDYSVQHEGTGRLYSTSQDMERIQGTITAGTSARMDLKIPPASTRTVLNRARVEADPVDVKLVRFAGTDQGLDLLDVETGESFPDDPMIVLVVHAGRVYEMKQTGDRLSLAPSTRRPLLSFLTDYFDVVKTTVPWRPAQPGLEEASDDQDVYREALRTLVGNTFGLNTVVDPTRLKLEDGIVRLFVYAPLPEALQMTGDAFPDQQGYVLYATDLLTQAQRDSGRPAEDEVRDSDVAPR